MTTRLDSCKQEVQLAKMAIDARHLLGLGYCGHLQLGLLFSTFFKRTFRLGRFSSKALATGRLPQTTTTKPAAADLQKSSEPTHAPKEIPGEVIERVAGRYFPEKNRYFNENIKCTGHELAYFGIDSEQKFEELLKEQIHNVLAEDAATAKEMLEPYREERESERYKTASAEIKAITDLSIERSEGGVFTSWYGLLSAVLVGRFGEAASREYLDKYILSKSPKSNAARSN